ncbi:LysM peptidoglycan-binding domain-containing protein [Cylindrospermum sp. FACHB-282]|uniref:LysM peptidoglycan-binding domain-containing protein n=1 Tax=Cylindrospermum sp. FACHB-282 TaxID=2692794 RepID=UPI001682AC1B|nr:LysM peptidoglycan-binding domain-containing protein [Cylindrospermum sp. FACHB-282]MBD2386403.1 LysM peptidoglycan-binding domain-containing protein [Cylindrospermum sp. FACHB-282]
MNLKLNCPVCGYQEIEGNTCPNCDTDLSLMRMLQELPQRQNSLLANFAGWPLGIALLMLIVGIGLGAFSSFVFVQPNFYTATISPANPVVMSTTSPKPAIAPRKAPATNTYIVKAGDSLSAIAKKLCGKETFWFVMVTANPQLKGRENDLEVGDKLEIPNCQEGN